TSLDVSLVEQSSTQQVLWVTNQGGGQVSFNASAGDTPWLTVTNGSGTASAGNPSPVSLQVDASSLPPGRQNATVMVTADGVDPLQIPVALTVTPSTKPKLLVSQTALSFRALVNSGGNATFPQSVGILNIGDGSMSWSAVASSSGNWLSISPSSGTSAAQGG